jgi:hypothetical protein
MPEVLVIDPHDADQVTSMVAENCSASFTTTVGFIGSISNAAGPDPESATACGLPLPESVNESVAVRVPLAVGLKTTFAEQLAKVARLVPHVLLLMAKSPALAPLTATLLMVIVELVPLVNVAVCAALVAPTAVPGNPSAVGETVTLPPDVLLPVPESAMVCGLLLAVSETLRVADRVPVVAGLNAMDTLHVAVAARLDPHVLLLMRKSPGSVPVIEILLIVMAELVPLLSVAVCEPLVDPVFIVPNERDVGLMLTVPLVPPGAKPDSATVCGVFVAESLKSSVAVRVPPVVGANVIFAEQLAPAARLVPQVFEKIRKSPGSAPASVKPLIVIGVDPLLVNVAVFWPPIPPTFTEAQLKVEGLANALPPEVPPGA